MRLRKFISQNNERFILFVGGIIFSTVVSSLLGGLISWSEAILIGVTVLMVIATVYYSSETFERTQSLINQAQTTVYYVDESYREQEGVKFKGIPYIELTRLVREANHEILTLSTSIVDDGRGRITDAHSSRIEYFSALEKNIVRHQESGFKYVRIQQMPGDGKNQPVSRYITRETGNHYRRIIGLERSIQNEKVNLSIMKVPTQRITSFIVIDRQYVLLIIDGIDCENRPYPAGMFVLEDRGGKISEHFVRYFENLERLAEPVTLAELDLDSKIA